jgi:hypothetical protein
MIWGPSCCPPCRWPAAQLHIYAYHPLAGQRFQNVTILFPKESNDTSRKRKKKAITIVYCWWWWPSRRITLLGPTSGPNLVGPAGQYFQFLCVCVWPMHSRHGRCSEIDRAHCVVLGPYSCRQVHVSITNRGDVLIRFSNNSKTSLRGVPTLLNSTC